MVRVIETSRSTVWGNRSTVNFGVMTLLLSLLLSFNVACGGSTTPSTDSGSSVDVSSSCSPGSSLAGDEACTACGAEECICLADNTWKTIGAACSASCSPGTTSSGDEACAACSCEECICLADKTWKCLGEACAVGTCEPGDTKDAGDGCNTCACDTTGEWQCTANTCGECVPGETKKTNDGCNDCFCNTDAIWDCGDDPCACEPGATKAAEDGCNTCECDDNGGWDCTTDPCGECSPGETKTAADECSECTCTNESTWSCDSSACTGCPPPKAHECSLKDSWAKNPNSDECCPYDSPCARPDENWQSYDSLEECNGGAPPGCTPGDTQPAGDDCNTCTCSANGEWECTTNQCGCTPGEITVNGCDFCVCNANLTESCSDNNCNICGVPWDAKVCEAVDTWAKEPTTGTCCLYAKPCWSPMGYEQFATEQACEDSNIPEPVCSAGETQTNDGCPDKPQANCTCNAAGTGWDCPTCPVCDAGETQPKATCPAQTCTCQAGQWNCPAGPCPECDPGETQPNPLCSDKIDYNCTCSSGQWTCPTCPECDFAGQQQPNPDCADYQTCTCSGTLTWTCPQDPCPECTAGDWKMADAPFQCNTCNCSPDGFWNCPNSPCPECTPGEAGDGPNAGCTCDGNGFWDCPVIEGCPSTSTVSDSECISSFGGDSAGAMNVWLKTNAGECCEYDNPCMQPPGDLGLGGPFFSASECANGSVGCPNISFCTLECCAPPSFSNCLKDGDGCDTCNCPEGGGPTNCASSPDGALPSGTPGQVVNNGCVQCTCVSGATGADWDCNDDACETCDPSIIIDAETGLGVWKIADDGCNGCHCSDAGGGDGYYYCSTYSCSPGVCAPPNAGWVGDTSVMWGLSPGGLCCPYPGPNAVPTDVDSGGIQGYVKFAEEVECHDMQILWGVPGAPNSEPMSTCPTCP
jgi:hypothetical protein